jgi:hypothetical protein
LTDELRWTSVGVRQLRPYSEFAQVFLDRLCIRTTVNEVAPQLEKAFLLNIRPSNQTAHLIFERIAMLESSEYTSSTTSTSCNANMPPM